MKLLQRFTLAVTLTATLALAGACAKSEPAAPIASETPAQAAPGSDAGTATPSTPTAGTMPAPGSPVATFVPTSTDPAPMLPMLGSTPVQPPSDEHSQTPAKADVRRIAPEEAAMLVQSGEAVLVDVRSKEAFQTTHIKGALSIPYTELSGRARSELTPTRWIIPYCT